ncbi:glycoside hydrolase family 25 protein [Limnovirga soli]|uniref:glycoside hydrolase family 25 protein n=1 Tax=Limnovirga soli TaxID=2656915 RepID=UPI0014911E4A|nr:glycoside hydrolase family 25 protein [Limnovirga soli]
MQVSVKKLNRRSGVPANLSDKTNIIGTVQQGFRFEGEEVSVTNSALGKWYKDSAGSFYWGGGLIILAGKVISNFRDLPVNLPSNFKFGIDISHHNDKLDWQAIKNAGCEFVYIKTSDGVNTPDIKALINAQNALRNNFKIGYYHFCHADMKSGGTIQKDAEAEANDYMTRMNNLPPADLPLVLDLEDDNTPLTSNQYKDWVEFFIAAIKPPFNQKGIMIYSRTEFLNRRLPTGHGLGKNIKLWISRYPTHPDANNVPSPIGWDDWSIWQYKDTGIIGTSGHLDLNIMKDSSLF